MSWDSTQWPLRAGLAGAASLLIAGIWGRIDWVDALARVSATMIPILICIVLADFTQSTMPNRTQSWLSIVCDGALVTAAWCFVFLMFPQLTKYAESFVLRAAASAGVIWAIALLAHFTTS